VAGADQDSAGRSDRGSSFDPELDADDPVQWLGVWVRRGYPGAREALERAKAEVAAGARPHDAYGREIHELLVIEHGEPPAEA
jgi:hypothetical protein